MNERSAWNVLTPPPEHRPTWRQIEERSRYCPVLYAAVTRVRQGLMTELEALIAVSLWLSVDREEALKRAAAQLAATPATDGPYAGR